MKFPAMRHLAVSTLLFTGLGAALPALADPPPWAPAHGRRAHLVREHHYVYYPAQRVYYEPAQRMWFWMNGAGWQFGVNLPAQYRVYADDGVQVMLRSSRPYVEHAYVEEHYGRPWRERHRHDHRDRREWHEEHHHDDHRGHDHHHDHDGR